MRTIRTRTPNPLHTFRSYPGYEVASKCRKCNKSLSGPDDDYGWIEGNKIPVHLCRECWLRIVDEYPDLSGTKKFSPWIWKFPEKK